MGTSHMVKIGKGIENFEFGELNMVGVWLQNKEKGEGHILFLPPLLSLNFLNFNSHKN